MGSSSRNAAHKHVDKKLASSGLYSPFWPNVDHKNLKWEIDARIDDPDRIYQATSNLCGMASFFNSLAWDDPLCYAYYLCSMYRTGSAYLGNSTSSPIVSAGKLTRSSKVPPTMASADWIALASLRDKCNVLLGYSYNMGVPGLKDIPLLGFFGTPNFVEPVGGISWPHDVANAMLAVGYKVASKAAINQVADASAMDQANAYFDAGWKVLLLIHTGIEDDDAGKKTFAPNHWVRLYARIETKGKGVRAWVHDSATGSSHWLPTSGKFIDRSVFRAHYYGFVAGRK
jgi:hypothetical protein